MALIRPLLLASFLLGNLVSGEVDRLNDSPRLQEWITIPSHGKALRAFLVYPETDRPVAAVMVIHENRGLTDWVRSVADRLAEEGYLAIAPDLLSGQGPNGGGTADFDSPDAARNAIYDLIPGVISADLDATMDRVKDLPACNGVAIVAGFSWGGSQSFRFATHRRDLPAAFVFYGTAPGDDFEQINCPVYGFYGGDDNRVNATIPLTEDVMLAQNKVYEPLTYHRAGHAYMRLGGGPEASDDNRIARNASWDRWLAILAEHAEPGSER